MGLDDEQGVALAPEGAVGAAGDADNRDGAATHVGQEAGDLLGLARKTEGDEAVGP